MFLMCSAMKDSLKFLKSIIHIHLQIVTSGYNTLTKYNSLDKESPFVSQSKKSSYRSKHLVIRGKKAGKINYFTYYVGDEA